MVGFAERLAEERAPEWDKVGPAGAALAPALQRPRRGQGTRPLPLTCAPPLLPPPLQHYLAYDQLKRAVRGCRQAADEQPALLDARRTEFAQQLDGEVLKVLAFYQRESAVLLAAVAAAEASVAAAAGGGHPAGRSLARAAALDGLAAEVQRLMQCTTQLLQYVAHNQNAIRKILKKVLLLCIAGTCVACCLLLVACCLLLHHAPTLSPPPTLHAVQFAKNVQGQTTAPVEGHIALEIGHPDDAGAGVRVCSRV